MLDNFINKIKGKTVSQLVNGLINRIFHLESIRYNIMELNLKSFLIPEYTDITIKPMEAEDTRALATDYFCDYDHEAKRKAILNKDMLYNGFMCYDKAYNFIGYCWIMYRGSVYEFFRIMNTDAYLAEFYINKEVRGRGLGLAMLLSVCDILKSRGLDQIKLAVRENNKSAIRCYKKAGFTYIRQYRVFRNGKKRKVYPLNAL